MKRLCLYLTYDKQKIVDKYIGYMLQELKTCVTDIFVICNQPEIERGKDILEGYADRIFYRENIGFDAGGFKDALCKLIGWEQVYNYNELVLVNDSIFGPFIPMREIFDKMEESVVDFWGLTKHAEFQNSCVDGAITPEHIQSFFLVVREKMLKSAIFKEYWEDMPYFASLQETIDEYEKKFTTYFSKQGDFNFAVYADTAVNDSSQIKNNYNQTIYISEELIGKRNFPFLKRRQLAYDMLNRQTQENYRLAIEHIDKNTNYDVNLIWDNVLRVFDICDIYRNFHLNYIVSEKVSLEQDLDKKFKLFVFVQYKSAVEYVDEYLGRLHIPFAILICSTDRELLRTYEMKGYCCEVATFNNLLFSRERWGECEYFGVIHDVDMSSEIQPNYIAKSYFFSIWENIIKEKRHVYKIIEQFEEESRLGLLMAPTPVFGSYFGNMGRGWNDRYYDISNILKQLGLSCSLSYEKPLFATADNFWVRSNILQRMCETASEHINYASYLLVYFAQAMGFYSGVLNSTDYAAMDTINTQHFLTSISRQIYQQFGEFQTFEQLQRKLNQQAVERFCKKYQKVYVYGTGQLAALYRNDIPNLQGYVVSDGQQKNPFFNGLKTYYLSELELGEKEGIIVCLSPSNREQVLPLLYERGIQDYFCI